MNEQHIERVKKPIFLLHTYVMELDFSVVDLETHNAFLFAFSNDLNNFS